MTNTREETENTTIKDEKKRKFSDREISIISFIVGTVIGITSIIIALTAWQDSRPYFIITHEIDSESILHVILRNEGKPIRRARCEVLCFAEIEYDDRIEYVPFSFNNPFPKYDYGSAQFDIPQFTIDKMVQLFGWGEPFWKFNLEETLYSKWAVENGHEYTARSINAFYFVNYYIVSYIDYRDKQRTEVFRQYIDDDYARVSLSDIPEAKDSSPNHTIEEMDSTEFCAYVFSRFGIQYIIEEDRFVFIR